MRRLIRCKTTKAFLTQDRTWTQDVREAADFHDQSRALELKRQLRLNDIELYYLFGDEPNAQYDFAFPL